MHPDVRRPGPVLLGAPGGAQRPGEPGHLEVLAEQALAAATRSPRDADVAPALALARDLGARVARPGCGRTVELWETLATLGAVDLQVARAVEPHLDALAILAEAGQLGQSGQAGATWGVYAAEGPGVRLSARGSAEPGDSVRLHGTKPWCSLAGDVSHALITAWVDDTERGLYAVALDHPGVRLGSEAWVARGLPDIRSTSVVLDDVPAHAVGGPGWYQRRDGFAWGGIGVAAVWYGAAVGVARRLWRKARDRTPDQIALAHLGAVDAALSGAREILAAAAAAVDAGQATGGEGNRLALRVRQVVAEAAEGVLRRADHGLGPAPLVLEPEHAARVADLHLYLRQHHAERDAAALGRIVVDHPSW